MSAQSLGPIIPAEGLQSSQYSSLAPLLPPAPVPALHAPSTLTCTPPPPPRDSRSSSRSPAQLPRFTSRPGRMPAAAGSVAAISVRGSPLRAQQTGALRVFNRYHGRGEVTGVPSSQTPRASPTDGRGHLPHGSMLEKGEENFGQSLCDL